MATDQDKKEEQGPQFDYEDLDERTRKQVKNSYKYKCSCADKCLNSLIDGKIACNSRDEFGLFMNNITEFIDGFVYNDDYRVITTAVENLTTLETWCFSYNELLLAIDTAYAVGVENSVILLQDSPVTDVEILYEDLKEIEKNSDNNKELHYGWLLVYRDKISFEEIERAFDNAVREDVISAQNKKFKSLTGFKKGHWRDVNYRDELRKAQAKIFDKYSKKLKEGYEEQRKLLQRYEYRPDVLFNTVEHHKEIYEKLLANETKE